MANAGPISDPRRNPRHKVLKAGKLVSLTLQSAVDVTIIDMSAGGARIRTPAITDCPQAFNLLVVSEKLLYPSVVRWRSGATFGVEFVGEPCHTGLRKWDEHTLKAYSRPSEAPFKSTRPGQSFPQSARLQESAFP